MLADFADEFNMDDEQTESIKNMGFRELSVWKDYLERVIQRRSRREILEIGKHTQGIINVIKETQKKLNSNRKVLKQIADTDCGNQNSKRRSCISKRFISYLFDQDSKRCTDYYRNQNSQERV